MYGSDWKQRQRASAKCDTRNPNATSNSCTELVGTMAKVPLDPHDGHSILNAYVKMRMSLTPVEVVVWFTGSVYAYSDGDSHHLFEVEGYNIGRSVRTSNGFDLLSREVMLYCHPHNNVTVHEFQNPFTGRLNQVLHRWNDPLNVQLRSDDASSMPQVLVAGAHVHMCTDVVENSPNPLPPRRWPVESGGDEYRHTEFSRLIATVADVDDDGDSAPTQVSIIRFGPWLPWMGMGDTPGHLIYRVGGCQLDGYQSLSSQLRTEVEDGHPEFMFAPASLRTPNETEWTMYSKLRRPMLR